jgi:hypothetical protein
MYILDTDNTIESPTLDRLLRDWGRFLLNRRARFGDRLRGRPIPESQAEDETNEGDGSPGLIL